MCAGIGTCEALLSGGRSASGPIPASGRAEPLRRTARRNRTGTRVSWERLMYCSNCGIPTLGGGPCTRCGHVPTEPVNPADVPAAGVDDARSPDQRYMATPFQFGLLSFVTGGAYTVYWLFKLRRVIDYASGKEVAPWYWWLGLLVPLLNLFLYFGTLNDLEVKVAAAGRRPPTLWLVGLLGGVLGGTWRLPYDWWWISFLGFIPLAIVQSNALAWQRQLYNAPPRAHRFRWWEWLIIAIGAIILLVAAVGSLIPSEEASTPSDPWVVAGVLVIAVGMLIWMGLAGESWARPPVDPNVKREVELAESNWRAQLGSLPPPHDQP